MRGLALIDENNWGWAAAAKMNLSVGEQHTGAVYGVLRRLREVMHVSPRYAPMFLADGKSWRYDVMEGYKISREKEAVSKQEKLIAGIRESWGSQKKLLRKAVELLGVSRMFAFNMEADDLASIIVRHSAKKRAILLFSGDKDWIQLVRPNVAWVDLINNRRIGSKTFAEKNHSTESVGVGFERAGEWIGLKNPRQWSDVKCLMGDPSDEISGVGGIGEKGALELVATYGSVSTFLNRVLERSIDVEKLPKKFRDFANAETKHDIYYRNDMLMNLEYPKIPAPNGLKISNPELDREGFKEFCREWLFQSLLTDFDQWIQPFERNNNGPTA